MILKNFLLHFPSLPKLYKMMNLKLKDLNLNLGSIQCYWMFWHWTFSWFLWISAPLYEIRIIISIALREANEIMNIKVFCKLKSITLTFVRSTYVFSAYFYAEFPFLWSAHILVEEANTSSKVHSKSQIMRRHTYEVLWEACRESNL